ncbi:MAG TPA: GNAT family N-acetyltransferase [bacterium]|nr:GNAT family N-acetyltransferase [bacterium]
MTAKLAQEQIRIRLIQRGDMDAIVFIDAQSFGKKRPEYYEQKVDLALDDRRHLVTSLVAEVGGKVVGFIMGEIYRGEFGIPDTVATIDTIGVDSKYQRNGIGQFLMEEFVTIARKAGVEVINTRVAWNDWDLLRFFDSSSFQLQQSKAIHLERRL